MTKYLVRGREACMESVHFDGVSSRILADGSSAVATIWVFARGAFAGIGGILANNATKQETEGRDNTCGKATILFVEVWFFVEPQA